MEFHNASTFCVSHAHCVPGFILEAIVNDRQPKLIYERDGKKNVERIASFQFVKVTPQRMLQTLGFIHTLH